MPVSADQDLEITSISPLTNPKLQAIFTEILAALKADQLEIPVLPDMAFKVRELIEDPDSSIDQFVKLLSTDLAITLYIIKAANSAALSIGRPVGNLREAIPRLGSRLLYSMVLNLTLTKLFQAKSPLIHSALKELWERCRIVAANSYVLAQHEKHLKPEDAMLAGLVHEIGALPLYFYADRCYPEIDSESLEILIRTFSAPIGFRLLQSWNFPEELIDVVTYQLDLRHVPQTVTADYVDVVTLAKFLMRGTPIGDDFPSAKRLGYNSERCANFFINNTERIAAINDVLGVGQLQVN
jgi:HD-like signal output (HDOD) protein